MKKMLSLLLVMIICFSISSCGGSEDPDIRTTPDIPQTEDSDTVSKLKDKVRSTDNCAAVIRIHINPIFDIYMDDNNVVIAVDAVNDDAQQVLSHTDIIGHNGIDAVCVLINTTFSIGLVNSDAVVYVTPVYGTYNPQTEELIKDIPSAVSDTYHNFYVKVEISDEMVEVEDTGDADTGDTTEVSDTETKTPDTQVIKDKKGNIIKSVQVDEVGNMVTYFYDKDGRLTKETSERADEALRETIYSENGLPVKTTIDFEDGRYEELIFNEKGRLVRHTIEESDGTMTETTLDGNGKPLYQTGTVSDGGIVENTYHLNGEIKEATIKYADGAYNRQIFDENGIKLVYEGAYVRVDGILTDFKFRYDANGNETEYWGQDNFGRPVHSIYNSDGTSVTYRTEEDGSVTAIYYDSSGKIIH